MQPEEGLNRWMACTKTGRIFKGTMLIRETTLGGDTVTRFQGPCMTDGKTISAPNVVIFPDVDNIVIEAIFGRSK